jgi:hypothetical protein
MEFYNYNNELFKIIEIKSIYQLSDGKYIIKDMVASNLVNSRKSEIVFINIATGINVDDSFFTLQTLER